MRHIRVNIGCIFNNYSPKWRWIAVVIYRAAKRRGKYPPLFTDTEVNNCFSIYQTSWIAGLKLKVLPWKKAIQLQRTEHCAHEKTTAREKSHDNTTQAIDRNKFATCFVCSGLWNGFGRFQAENCSLLYFHYWKTQFKCFIYSWTQPVPVAIAWETSTKSWNVLQKTVHWIMLTRCCERLWMSRIRGLDFTEV